MQNTKIQWTATVLPDGRTIPGHTWNPWQGCAKVSDGCENCYMFRDKKRYGQDPEAVVRSKPPTFNRPLTWREPARVFTCSWSDWFIREADPWRPEAWDIIRRTPHLTYQILTKRPARIPRCLPPDWGNGYPNVWLGVSVEDQATADARIPQLLDTPARVRFLSCEPLLDAVDLSKWVGTLDLRKCERCWGVGPDGLACSLCGRQGFAYPAIDWVIVGGESGGREAREMDCDWAGGIVRACRDAGVAVFVKQLGSVWARQVGAKDPHGGEMREWPAFLQAREFPGGAK
jgi:protein gp37